MDFKRAIPVTIRGTEVDVGDASSVWQNLLGVFIWSTSSLCLQRPPKR